MSAASSSQVKMRASDLIESQFGSFTKYQKLLAKGGRIPEIMNDWSTRQMELMQEGLATKEIANIATDKRRNKDLDFLKSVGAFSRQLVR